MKKFIKGLFKFYVYGTSTVFTILYISAFKKVKRNEKQAKDYEEENVDFTKALNGFASLIKNLEK